MQATTLPGSRFLGQMTPGSLSSLITLTTLAAYICFNSSRQPACSYTNSKRLGVLELPV